MVRNTSIIRIHCQETGNEKSTGVFKKILTPFLEKKKYVYYEEIK
jgi:hypothetical protein